MDVDIIRDIFLFFSAFAVCNGQEGSLFIWTKLQKIFEEDDIFLADLAEGFPYSIMY